MIIPALLYLCINYQEDGAHGWEFQWPLILPYTRIDGSARKQSARALKAFISALAVSDDLVILVIAFFMATAISTHLL
jgi:Na+/H+ antiporter NhaA